MECENKDLGVPAIFKLFIHQKEPPPPYFKNYIQINLLQHLCNKSYTRKG